MASSSKFFASVRLLLLLSLPIIISAADPDSLQNFCVADTKSSMIFMNGLPCLNSEKALPDHFKTSALSSPANTSASPMGLSVVAITPQNMPGMNALGLTMIRIDLAVGAVVPPHTHPRASEMAFVLQGTLNVGFVDTNNKLFSQQINPGEVFVFPKATVHFLHNKGKTPASVIGSLNSQNPGTSLVSLATFASNPSIPNDVLTKAFQMTDKQVNKIKRNLVGN